MLLSQNLIEHRTFQLDQYFVPRPPIIATQEYTQVGNYRLELVNDHTYYFFPVGSSVLSVPYVALLKLFGINARDQTGSYGELLIQTSLAALLMAGLAVVFFGAARFVLNRTWSVVVALGGVFGSQVWSTASRGLWSHTWNLLLLGLVIYLLTGAAAGKRKLRPAVLATLLGWAYFVRPTSSVPLMAVMVYLAILSRRSLAIYLGTLMFWFAGFVYYSWHNFGKLLPSYYAGSRLHFDVLATALGGNLISPGRGLIVYVPWVLFMAYLLVRFRKQIELSALMWLSVAVIAGELLVLAGFSNWWGGVSYGARLTTDLLPWLFLLTIIGLDAMLRARAVEGQREARYSKPELLAGAFLLAFAILVNGYGAVSQRAQRWNDYPKDDRLMQVKIWSWKQPQFLAGLNGAEAPTEYPLFTAGQRIDVTSPEAEKYLWLGWARPEGGLRWTEGKKADVVFSLSEIRKLELGVMISPFLVPGRVNEQTLEIELNGHSVETVSLQRAEFTELLVDLPADKLRERNVLSFKLPNATSPASLRMSIDQRELGLAVKSLRFERPFKR